MPFSLFVFAFTLATLLLLFPLLLILLLQILLFSFSLLPLLSSLTAFLTTCMLLRLLDLDGAVLNSSGGWGGVGVPVSSVI